MCCLNKRLAALGAVMAHDYSEEVEVQAFYRTTQLQHPYETMSLVAEDLENPWV